MQSERSGILQNEVFGCSAVTDGDRRGKKQNKKTLCSRSRCPWYGNFLAAKESKMISDVVPLSPKKRWNAPAFVAVSILIYLCKAHTEAEKRSPQRFIGYNPCDIYDTQSRAPGSLMILFHIQHIFEMSSIKASLATTLTSKGKEIERKLVSWSIICSGNQPAVGKTNMHDYCELSFENNFTLIELIYVYF